MTGSVKDPVPEQAPAGRTVKLKRFYNSALSRAERADLSEALEVEGVDEEIAVLRLLLRRALKERPAELQLMFRGIELLTRAVAARYRLPGQDRQALLETVGATTRTLAEDIFSGGGVEHE